MKASAGGHASKSVAPSPIMTRFLYPNLSFSLFITTDFPPLSDVGSFSSKPAYSPEKTNNTNKYLLGGMYLMD